MIDRHQMFADEYLSNGFNASAAYMVVYKGVDEDTAKANGSRLLAKDSIKAYIDEKILSLRQEKKIEREDLVNELLQIISSCKTQGVDGEGKITDRSNWNKAVQTLSKLLGYDSKTITHSGKIEHDHFTLKFPGVEVKNLPASNLDQNQINDVDQEEYFV